MIPINYTIAILFALNGLRYVKLGIIMLTIVLTITHQPPSNVNEPTMANGVILYRHSMHLQMSVSGGCKSLLQRSYLKCLSYRVKV